EIAHRNDHDRVVLRIGEDLAINAYGVWRVGIRSILSGENSPVIFLLRSFSHMIFKTQAF
ncbi:MAG: hypothetical protein Q4D38_14670, partial [Planctomycetia bacterium]|nr:hypothetical protein [Planctomycetia bacterium]